MIRRHSSSAERAQAAARVAGDEDPVHPFRDRGHHVADDADDEVGGVLAAGPVDPHELVVLVEVVLDEARPRGSPRAPLPAA